MLKENIDYNEIGINPNSATFKNYRDNGLLNTIDRSYAKEVREFWKNTYGRKTHPLLHLAYQNITGKKDLRLIPGEIMTLRVLPVFNDYDMTTLYGDKNLYSVIMKAERSPETVIKNVRGTYFDANHNSIDIDKINKILLDYQTDLIVKPSKSNNGNGIRKIKYQNGDYYLRGEKVGIKELEELYKQNFLIQIAIKQHPNIAAPHPSSVNTIRLVTFRWKNEIRVLLGFARFGANNDVQDNGSVDVSPCVGISDTGEFLKTAISKNGTRYTHHPTTGFCFADLEPIPNFDEYKQLVKGVHKNILHLNFISWDIAVGEDGKPILIEGNFAGSLSFYQLAAQKPIFGDMTEEVLNYVEEQHKIKKPKLMKRHRNARKRRKQKRLEENLSQNRKKVTSLTKQLDKEKKHKQRIVKKYKKELKELQKKHNRLLNSKSYRYTRPIRKIVKWFK